MTPVPMLILINVTEVEGGGLTHDAEVVCPGSQSPVSRHELPEVLLAVPEEVFYPDRGLGQIHERVDHSFAERSVISRDVRDVMKDNLKKVIML